MRKTPSNSYFKIVCISLSIILFVPNLFPGHLNPLPFQDSVSERFQPALVNEIRSVDELLLKADSIAGAQQVQPQSLSYAEILVDLVKNRFYHGYSHYALNENWMAAALGATFWDDLSAIVIPDDILNYPMAACSQQSIVLAESFKRKGIPYRKVGFDHHFALEASIDGQWYYFDANKELELTHVKRASFESLYTNNQLYTVFGKHMSKEEVDRGLAHHFYGLPNENLAQKATLFHQATKVLSRVLFLFPLLLLAVVVNKRKPHLRYVFIPANVRRAVASIL